MQQHTFKTIPPHHTAPFRGKNTFSPQIISTAVSPVICIKRIADFTQTINKINLWKTEKENNFSSEISQQIFEKVQHEQEKFLEITQNSNIRIWFLSAADLWFILTAISSWSMLFVVFTDIGFDHTFLSHSFILQTTHLRKFYFSASREQIIFTQTRNWQTNITYASMAHHPLLIVKALRQFSCFQMFVREAEGYDQALWIQRNARLYKTRSVVSDRWRDNTK